MAVPAISLDRTSPVPLYFQVAEQLEAAIRDGQMAPGDRLENEVSMAQDLGLSRPTMRQAIQTLVDKGLVVRRRGVGTQVVQGQVRRDMELTSLYDDLATSGGKPTTRVLALTREAADSEVARLLRLDDGAPVWSLSRLRLLDDTPLALMHNTLPADLAELDAADLAAGGLYAWLRTAGVVMRVAQQSIGARAATAEEATLLQERPGAPLLTMERTSYDDSGRPIEIGRHVYRPDRYSFDTTLIQR